MVIIDLKEINSIDKSLSKEEYLKNAKGLVHSKILLEIEKWVDKKISPEIIEVCKEIMKNESILIGDFKKLPS
jgi:hypothetical protein